MKCLEYGIFQEKLQQGKYSIFWNIEYNRSSNAKLNFCAECKVCDIPKRTCYIKNLEFFGIWNIPKILQQEKTLSFVIWNIPGTFQNNIKTKILKILEYGIFLENSKQC